jgi:hypothetical protein
VPPCQMQTWVAHRNRSSNCRGLAFNYGANARAMDLPPAVAGSTIYDEGSQNCARMNVASVLDRFGGRYLVGALSFSPILKIGPVPTPATPGFQRPVSSRHNASTLGSG